MSYDYWTMMAEMEWPDIDAKITEFVGRKSKREAWMQQQLKPLFGRNASGLAYYRAFERAALAFRYYDATEEDDEKRREDVKTAYSAILVPGYSVPGPLINLKTALALDPPSVILSHLPKLSAVWQFRFELASDYLSQDDVGLYAIDNPVRKEHVLKLPMVASTAWKGALRSAFRARHNVDDKDPAIVRLFGEKRGDEEGQAGQLYFFPTYFAKLGLAVINPHDRRTGVGERGPILFETVPAGSRGYFTLLYVPRGDEKAQNVADDMRKTAQALQAMLTMHGFGAKTSSGYGTAKTQVYDFRWAVHAFATRAPAEVEAPDRTLEADITAFVQRFSLTDFPYWTNSELNESGWGKKRISAYKRLRARHPDWDAQTRIWREAAPPPKPERVPLEETAGRFDLTNLSKVAGRLAAALREEASNE